MLIEGIKKAGNNVSRERLTASLEELTRLDLGSCAISCGVGNRNGSRFVDTAVVTTGGRLLF